MTSEKPIDVTFLRGIRVLLVGYYVPCPFAAWLLRGLGAEIVKVEPPFGDLMRQLPPFLKGRSGPTMSAFFRALNGGFGSIAIDFKKAAGVEVLRDLVKNCDIVLDGNRHGYLEKLLGGPLAAIRPDIIHVPVTGYGLRGPMADLACHDNNALALNGTLSFANPGAAVFGVQVADILAGTTAATMALAALCGRLRGTTRPELNVIDASMLHAANALTLMHMPTLAALGRPPAPGQELLNGGLPNYRIYRTADGRALCFGPIEPKLFANFCEKVARPDLLDLFNRLGNDDAATAALHAALEKTFANSNLATWKVMLRDCDCCTTPVNDLREAVADEHLRALGLAFEIDDAEFGRLCLGGFPAGFTSASRQPTGLDAPAPGIGQHTTAILHDVIRYDESRIATLLADGAVRTSRQE